MAGRSWSVNAECTVEKPASTNFDMRLRPPMPSVWERNWFVAALHARAAVRRQTIKRGVAARKKLVPGNSCDEQRHELLGRRRLAAVVAQERAEFCELVADRGICVAKLSHASGD